MARTRVLEIATGPAAALPSRAGIAEVLRANPSAACAIVMKGSAQPVVLKCEQALERLGEVGNVIQAVLLPAPGEDPADWARAIASLDSVAVVERWLADDAAERHWRVDQISRQTAAQQAAAEQRDALRRTLERWLSGEKRSAGLAGDPAQSPSPAVTETSAGGR